MGCTSCHDPHGKYRRFADGTKATTGLPIFNSGSYTSSAAPVAGVSAVGVYRLLAGKNYQPKSLSGSYAFVNDSPDAVVKSSYNGVSTDVTTTAGQKDLVAYGQGMSEYCANCHTKMLDNAYTSGMKGLVHPAGNAAKLAGMLVLQDWAIGKGQEFKAQDFPAWRIFAREQVEDSAPELCADDAVGIRCVKSKQEKPPAK